MHAGFLAEGSNWVESAGLVADPFVETHEARVLFVGRFCGRLEQGVLPSDASENPPFDCVLVNAESSKRVADGLADGLTT